MGIVVADNTGKAHPQDVALAQALHAHLSHARRTTGGTNLEKWADEFRLLRKYHNATHEAIAKAVEWLGAHLKDEFTPVVASAKGFRTKYPYIVATMERQQANAPTAIEITDKDRKIEQRVALLWPKGTKVEEYLPMIAHSRAAAATLYARWYAKSKSHPRYAKHYGWLLAMLGDAGAFTESWVVWVWRVAHKWPHWKGNLLKWRFRPTHKRFQEMALGWLTEYCGANAPNVWPDVLETLA